MSVASLGEWSSAAGPVVLSVLVDAAIKGAAILVVTSLAVLAMRRASAAARHLVWFLGALSVLLLPILSVALPGWNILPSWANNAALSAPAPIVIRIPAPSPLIPPAPRPRRLPNEVAQSAQQQLSPNIAQQIPAIPPQMAPPQTVAIAPIPAPSHLRLPWQTWALLAWIAGSVVLLGYVAMGFVSLRWLQRQSSRIDTGDWPILLGQLSRQLGLHRPVELRSSSRRTMPMTWGFWRVRVLLPEDSAIWTPEQRRAVLLHELAHARRWDCLTQLVAQLACALYWFNPLLWLAWKRMQSEREQACDDFVLGTGTRASAYAEQLLHIAAQMPTVRYSAAAIAMARPSKLEGRLLAILDVTRNRRRLTRRAVMIAAAAALAIAIPLACMRASGPASQAAKPAATQPASGSSTVATTAGDQWRKRLANGVTVEVVCSTTRPSAGQAWCLPDGSPLGYQPDFEDSAQLAELAKERPALGEVAVRMDDMPVSKDLGARDTAVFIDGRFATEQTALAMRKIISHSDDDKTQSLWMILMPSFPRSQPRTTIRIGVATGSWEPIADGTFDGTAWTVHPAVGKGGNKVDVSFAGPYQIDSSTAGYGMAPGYDLRYSAFGLQLQQAFVVTAALTLPADRQVCIVGIAADGTEAVAGMMPQISDGHVQQIAGYFDGGADFAALGFKAFRVESRPMQFVEFKDIALAPSPQAATRAGAPTAQPATQPGMRLVDDPVAAIRAVLPDGFVIQKVEHDSSPYGLEPNDARGLGITINLSPAELARTPTPQGKGIPMPMVVSIMPPDYQGRVMNEVGLQFAPARMVGSTPQGNIFVWGGNWGANTEDIQPKVLAALLAQSPPATQPAGAATQQSSGD